MAKQSGQLGRVQLEVLRFVAEHHPIRVSEVAEHFAEASGQARTTILTVMERLREKGYLTRRKVRGTYHYSPRQAARDVTASIIRRFIEESLGGSVSPLIAYLAESRGLSDSEVEKLKELVRELEADRGEDEQ